LVDSTGNQSSSQPNLALNKANAAAIMTLTKTEGYSPKMSLKFQNSYFAVTHQTVARQLFLVWGV
jgi:hypothetical protein